MGDIGFFSLFDLHNLIKSDELAFVVRQMQLSNNLLYGERPRRMEMDEYECNYEWLWL